MKKYLAALGLMSLPIFRPGADQTVTDAKDTAFLAQELEQLESEIYRTEYPDLIWRKVLPVKNTGLNPGADSFAYRVYDWFGQAKFIHAKALDLMQVEVAGEKFTSKVETCGDSYSYDVTELAAAAMSGFPLESEKAAAAHEAIERLMDTTTAVGDPQFGFPGFLKLSGVSIDSPTANGDSGGTTWASKLALSDGSGPTKILADLHRFMNGMVVASKQKIRPDRLVMSQNAYNIISTTPMSPLGYSTETILSTFLKTSPFIKSEAQIIVWYQADTAGADGKGRLVAYKADRRYCEVYVPLETQALAPQPRGLNLVVPLYARYGGVVLRMPLSVRYFDGIDT